MDQRSIVARNSLPFWLWFSFAIIALGAVRGSIVLISLLHSVRYAESAGLLAVGRGIAEANQPVLIALCVGTIAGAVGAILSLRSSQRNVSSPPWLLLIAIGISLFPVSVFWIAESMMIKVLPFSREGVVEGAGIIEMLLSVSLGVGVVLAILLLLGPILRVRLRPMNRKVLVGLLLLVVAVLIVAVTAFQLRNAWINSLYEQL